MPNRLLLCDADDFENEVRRIARLLWPGAEYGGAAKVLGQQRDGLFETEEVIHFLEATTSRSPSKATEDATKLAKLADHHIKSGSTKSANCWLVTRFDPEADQRTAVTQVAQKWRMKINLLSFSSFQSQLVDAASYLSARSKHPFGSVRDPVDGSLNPSCSYVQMSILEEATQRCWALHEIIAVLRQGTQVVLLGDYGAGKSMTLREIFRALASSHDRTKSPLFPVYLNLREHVGQRNPAEVLHRHAENVGFHQSSHLVRAWRAGYVVPILDGFDEITTFGIQGFWRKLKDVRYRAMEVVRAFLRDTPKVAGVVVAGRAHFFDNVQERKSALGVNDNAIELSVSDFTEEQVAAYIDKSGFRGAVPRWLPTRPLLVGYLVARGLLPGTTGDPGKDDPAVNDPALGWDALLNKIASREATIEAGIDGAAVRQILERLATLARCTSDGVGPITPQQVMNAFSQVCGYQPDEYALLLLQRLPGLGPNPSPDESRSFIDTDLADVCRCGDLVRYVNDPYSTGTDLFRDCECLIGALGIRTAAERLTRESCSAKKLNAALQYALHPQPACDVLAADILRAALECGHPATEPVFVHRVIIPELLFDQGTADMSQVEFHDCYLTKISIEPDVHPERLPRFIGCFVLELDGRVSERDLPPGTFDGDCTFDMFADRAESTDAILDLDMPLGAKVVLTILRKVYLQRGSGRRETALRRGLDVTGQRLVPGALRLLKSEGLITSYPRRNVRVWQPVRTHSARVGLMVTAPATSRDPLLSRAAEL